MGMGQLAGSGFFAQNGRTQSIKTNNWKSQDFELEGKTELEITDGKITATVEAAS
jgi:hypothetical protein